jgi:ABC-type transport system involved in cytochrome c biogenesis permease subunit
MTQFFTSFRIKFFIIHLLLLTFFSSVATAQTSDAESKNSKEVNFSQTPPLGISYFPQDKTSKLPVLYKGRIRPFSVAAKLWLYDITKRYIVKGSKFVPFKASFAEDLIWKITLFGPEYYQPTRIFFVPPSARKILGINPNKKRFTLYDLSLALDKSDNKNQEINKLRNSVQTFKYPDIYVIPLMSTEGNFAPLSSLETHDENFTRYSDEHFYEIKTLYLAIKESLQKDNLLHTQTLSFALVDKLIEAYEDLELKPLKVAQTKQITAPSRFTLELENILFSSSFLDIIFIFYAIATICFSIYYFKQKAIFSYSGYAALIMGFLVHSLLMILRSYILKRPPVSNMLETMIYVPWIAVFSTLIASLFSKNKLLPLASSLIGLMLFAIIGTIELNQSLENIQPVLDSNYWLTIHVLIIVASYGLFFLSGFMAHITLFGYFSKGTISDASCKFITQANYIAIALLIPGTILGGIWAAESWGRFWDWDPKESWAFISCATYLAIIHAHKYGLIKNLGLIVGSIIGFNIVTFTWYGVNYILGQGLHSYGFGSGGQSIYWVFVGIETLLLLITCVLKFRKRLN